MNISTVPYARTRGRARTGILGGTVLAAVLLSTTACVLKKPPETTALQQEALPAVKVPGQWTTAGAAAGAVSDNWIATFRDDQLSAAVAEAIANNADLRVAAAADVEPERSWIARRAREQLTDR